MHTSGHFSGSAPTYKFHVWQRYVFFLTSIRYRLKLPTFYIPCDANSYERMTIPKWTPYFLGMLLSTLMILPAVSQVDTLRNYDIHSPKIPYRSTNALYYLSRHQTGAPGYLQKIRVDMQGAGEMTIRLFGHEAGSGLAEVRKDMINPIRHTKNSTDRESIWFDIPEKPLLEHNQFFVVIELHSPTLQIMRDSRTLPPYCSSNDGGTYYPTVLAIPGNHQFYPHVWQVMSTPLVVDVVMKRKPTPPSPYLIDVTEQMGIPTNISSRTIAWADYDQDGYLDLLVGGRLFKNIMGVSFEEKTQELGIRGAARGNSFVDMNNDGLMDIIIFHNDNHLYLNNGDGTFQHSKLEIPSFPSLSSFSFADVNQDGYPDVFIGQLWGAYPVPLPNYLFINNGENTFQDQTRKLYPDYDGTHNFPHGMICDPSDPNTFRSNGNQNRRSRGSQFVDFDNDGDLDLYVANYFLERNELYQNDGNGNFTPVIHQTSIDITSANGSSHGTGVDWADFDHDGDMDLLQPNLAHPWGAERFGHQGTTIYKNTGYPHYSFETAPPQQQIAHEETHAGATWGDLNNDGFLDIITTTFYGCRYADIYLQNPDHSFSNASYYYGIHEVVTGEDALVVDFDNDGWNDLCLGNQNQFRLYKNTLHIPSRHFVSIDLRTTSKNRFAIGARIEVSSGGKTYIQELSLGRGVRMQKPLRAHFGLGNASFIDNITVKWPDGEVEAYGAFLANNHYTLHQGGLIDGQIQPSELQVYPNPSNGIVTVNVPAHTLTLFDMSGKIMIKNTKTHTLDIKNLTKGVYLLKVETDHHSSYHKIILSH